MDLRPHSLNRVLLGALALGALADALFYGRWLGISAPLFVGACLALLGVLSVSENRRPIRANLWLGAAALLFAVCLAVRDEPWLVAFDLLAVFGLLLVLLAHYRGPALLRLPLVRVVAQTLRAVGVISVRPVGLVAQGVRNLPVEPARLRRLAPLGRGLLLALPVLLCFGVLLIAADSVFASYVSDLFALRLPFDAGTALNHLLVILVAAYLVAGGLQIALLDDAHIERYADTERDLPAEGITQRLVMPASMKRWLGCTEALTVLVSVDLLFGGFMLVQAAYFFGGMDTLDRTGMTYAAYARHGFFELLTVTGLTLGMLWGLALITRRTLPWQQRAFKGASAALVVLTLGLLASAFQRMLLYEQAYGFTRLRIYTHSFMIWLAVALLIVLLAVLRDRIQLAVAGCLATGLVALALLNAISPDALIVRENIARYQASGKLDTYYLTSLSSDAVPDLVASYGQLGPQARTEMGAPLRGRLATLLEARNEQGWPSWQLGRAQAISQLQTLFGGGDGS